MSPLTIFAFLLAATLGVALFVTLSRQGRERDAHFLEKDRLQKALEKQMKRNRKERNRLLNALTDPFLLIDKNGQICFTNKAACKLLRSRSLEGRSIREAFTDPRLRTALVDGLASEDASKTRLTLPQQASPRGDQENRGMNSWIIDVAHLPSMDDSPPLSRVIIRDITHEYQTEQIRKDFVANASHELRTPMSIIHGYLENLLDDDMLEDEELARRFLTVMRKHSDRISRIIDDMLVISRLESGEETSLNIEPFSLRECIQDITERLESLIRTQEAQIQVKLSDDSIKLVGDRFYWTQALFNLIENALKQNPRPGLNVEIGCEVKDDRLEIWVKDDGIGIPSADLTFIFRRFYRVDKHHSQNEIKGTGLGLSIVKRAIEAHHGTIQATSTPGTETKFLISVPLNGPETVDHPVDADLKEFAS